MKRQPYHKKRVVGSLEVYVQQVSQYRKWFWSWWTLLVLLEAGGGREEVDQEEDHQNPQQG